jgi:hypothetical protein
VNDPADLWDAPAPSKFFGALSEADEQVAELAALRSAFEAGQRWQLIAEGIGQLLDRYHRDAADTDQQAALANVAGLLRHCSVFAAALAGEVHHWAAAADDADDLRRTAEARVVELESEVGWLTQELKAAKSGDKPAAVTAS